VRGTIAGVKLGTGNRISAEVSNIRCSEVSNVRWSTPLPSLFYVSLGNNCLRRSLPLE
jgi:hypothetical protein